MARKNLTKAWNNASIVCGIISIVLFLAPFFGLPLGIFSIVAYGIQGKKNQAGQSSAGLVLGVIGTLMNLATGLFFGLMFAITG